ncbi:MAG: hypothetical protein JSR96_04310 [Proteobacteria bacterium]|nr:hypothetical protein [Pseudomonadota bacterium]
MTRSATLPLLAMALALSACGSEPKKQQGAGTAQGEVLPGSASDAMLPYDSVRSQPALSPGSEGGDSPEANDTAKKETRKKDAGKKAAKPAASATPAAASEPDAPSAAEPPAG